MLTTGVGDRNHRSSDHFRMNALPPEPRLPHYQHNINITGGRWEIFSVLCNLQVTHHSERHFNHGEITGCGL